VSAPRTPRLYAEIFLLALGVILLEISYTRIFSFKLVYYFTYLIIGVALLGVGAGGVLVAVVPALGRRGPAEIIPRCALVAGAATLAGYLVIALTPLNVFSLVENLAAGQLTGVPAELTKLLLVCLALAAPFLLGGVALAVILARGGSAIGRLYFADLLGAGLGCVLCVPLMVTLGPPGTVLLAGVAITLSGLRLARSPERLALIAVTLALGSAAALAGRLPDLVRDRTKTDNLIARQNPPVIFSRWHPVFRVDVFRNALPSDDDLILGHDGIWGSVMRRFDGDAAALTTYDHNARALPFRVLGPHRRVAIVGAAGGNEILASLHFDAAHVTAIELNPVTVSLLTTHLAEFSGHLAENPRVTLVNAEGRSFLAREHVSYDLVWLVAPDSYAAMNAATSGAFVLSESYLYTVEMVLESLRRLTPDGMLCVQFGEVDLERKPLRTARFLATVREAFRRLGIDDVRPHVLVATTRAFEFPISTILVSAHRLTPDEVGRFIGGAEQIPGSRVLHAGLRSEAGPTVGSVLGLPTDALDAWYAAQPFDLRPVTDDSPFFWHFVRFRDVLARRVSSQGSWEEAMGEQVLLLLVGVATLLAAVFLFLPMLVMRGAWRAMPAKGRAAVYFACLGLGFMFFEVSLIQRLTLFLGYPTYSLTITLFSLLVFTGLGSLIGERYGDGRAVLVRLLGGVVVLALFYQWGLGPIVARLGGAALELRIAVAVVMLAPLGLCLGAFMPLGLRTVGRLTEHRETYVAWAWAVNGFCSVVASVLATILSMTIGFTWVLAAAAALYGLGVLAMAPLLAARPAMMQPAERRLPGSARAGRRRTVTSG
jgi:spermidine synthase